jgi:hypothetical protein
VYVFHFAIVGVARQPPGLAALRAQQQWVATCDAVVTANQRHETPHRRKKDDPSDYPSDCVSEHLEHSSRAGTSPLGRRHEQKYDPAEDKGDYCELVISKQPEYCRNA